MRKANRRVDVERQTVRRAAGELLDRVDHGPAAGPPRSSRHPLSSAPGTIPLGTPILSGDRRRPWDSSRTTTNGFRCPPVQRCAFCAKKRTNAGEGSRVFRREVSSGRPRRLGDLGRRFSLCDNPTDPLRDPTGPRRRGPATSFRRCRAAAGGPTHGRRPDRHLLFGLLALQNGLIDQAALVAAFQAWTRDKSRPLADHLVGLGHLDAEQRRRRRGPGRPAPEEARRRRGAEPGRRPRRRVDPRRPGRPRRPRPRGHPRPHASQDATRRRRRPRPHGHHAPSARPPPTASGSASSGRTPGGAWARSPWPSTPS